MWAQKVILLTEGFQSITSVLEAYSGTMVTKAELIQQLSAAGIEVSDSMIMPELRELWREHQAKTKASETTEPNILKALTSLTKPQLLQRCRDFDVPITGNELKDQLIIKIRDKALDTPPKGSDLMGFGQYAKKTYEGTCISHPEYVEWCKQTSKEGSISKALHRFLDYANRRPKVELPTKSEKIKGEVKLETKVKKEVDYTHIGTPPKGWSKATSSTASNLPGQDPDSRLDRLESMMTAMLQRMAQATPTPNDDMDETLRPKRQNAGQ